MTANQATKRAPRLAHATKRVPRLATLTVIAALLGACSTSTASLPSTASDPTPVTSGGAAVSDPTTPSQAATLPASAGAASAPTSDATPEATPASGAPAVDPSAEATTTLILETPASHASYHAQEQLAGRDLPSEAVGTTSDVSGSIVLGPDGSIVTDQSQIQVDLSSLASDQSRRDSFIQRSTLQTSNFPTATFVPRAAEGLPSPLPTSGQATFQLAGDLTVHGVTRPVTWQVTAQFDTGVVSGSATTNVNISDFGMTPPKAGPVLSIQDGLMLELNFNATVQA